MNQESENDIPKNSEQAYGQHITNPDLSMRHLSAKDELAMFAEEHIGSPELSVLKPNNRMRVIDLVEKVFP